MRQSWPLILIVLVAAALRFWGLSAGIPYTLNIDEPQIMSRALEMMKSGSFNPHFFDYPGLYIHLQLAVACLRFLYGATRGDWASLNDIGMEDFFLWGRAVTALFGTATVILVFLAGRRWGTTAALVAASAMAVFPSHVRESHFILTDTPVTFFVAAALVLALRAHETGRHRMFAAAGAMAGFAAATKYNGGLVMLVPLLVAALSNAGTAGGVEAPRRLRLASTTVVSTIAAFLLAAPYTILALPEFLNGFAHLATAYQARPADAESGGLIYLKHLRLNLGLVASALALGGLGVAAREGLHAPRRVRSLCVIVFPIAYLFVIADRGLIFGRYLLPMLPFAALLTGIAVASLAAGARARIGSTRLAEGLIAAIAVAALVEPARQAIGFDRALSVVTTPRLAYQWIADNVPKGAAIAIEGRALTLPAHRYKVRQVARVSDRPAAEIFGCYDYIVATSASYRDVLRDPRGRSDEHAAYADLMLKGRPLATFYPSAQHPGPELTVMQIAPNPSRPNPCP